MARGVTGKRTPKVTKGSARSAVRRELEEARNQRRIKRLEREGFRALYAGMNRLELAQRITGKLPKTEQSRTYFGRSLDLDRIDLAIRNVMRGRMREVTDMGRESLLLDGHTSGLLQKRINRASVFEWEVVANTGEGVNGFDTDLAEEIADHVRSQLMSLKDFRRARRRLRWGVWDGRAVLEKEWEIVPGPQLGLARPEGWRLKGLHWIHPRRVSFTSQRELVLIDNWSDGGFESTQQGVKLNEYPGKFLAFQPQLFDDYAELEGLQLRCLYWSFFQRLGTRERLELLEQFAKPWRWAYSDGDRPANADAIQDAFDILQNTSSKQAFWLSPGVKAEFYQPGPGSGQTHKETIEDARFVLSKLILGATGTTDAVSTGLGSSIGDAHLSEEDLVIAADTMDEDEAIEQQLCDEIVLLNYGEQALPYAPIFRTKLEAMVDRDKETLRLKEATAAGLRIPLEQAHERTGYRQPNEDEAFLALIAADAEPGFPAPEPRVQIVYPKGKAPVPGELAVPPAEPLADLPPPTGTPQQPPPATPPAAPAAPPATPPGEPTAPQDLPVPATEGGIIKPAFASPSGLSDADRD
jgi:phage gp29-like protein